jgi:hypothetical protein
MIGQIEPGRIVLLDFLNSILFILIDWNKAGLLMAAILYSWQFPHFHALSWNLRGEYSRAGNYFT